MPLRLSAVQEQSLPWLPTRIARHAAAALHRSQFRRHASWLLHYADLRTNGTLVNVQQTPEGVAFLATNLAYVAAGAAFAGPGNAPLIGAMFDLAATFSVWYHWEQCRCGGTAHPSVQLALLFDYAVAVPTAIAGLAYATALGPNLPIAGLVYGLVAATSFVAGWFFSKPRQYMVLHGAWHLFGAAAGAELAHAHQALMHVGGV